MQRVFELEVLVTQLELIEEQEDHAVEHHPDFSFFPDS